MIHVPDKVFDKRYSMLSANDARLLLECYKLFKQGNRHIALSQNRLSYPIARDTFYKSLRSLIGHGYLRRVINPENTELFLKEIYELVYIPNKQHVADIPPCN